MIVDKRRPAPLYHQLKEALKQEIRARELGPGAAVASERELMRRHKVSYMTVSRAMRDLVHEGVLYREQGRGTFVAAPSGPAARATTSFGVVTFTESMDRLDHGLFAGELLQAIESELSSQNHSLLFGQWRADGPDLPLMVRERQVDGLFLMQGIVAGHEAMIDCIEDIPFILVGNYLQDRPYPAVIADNRLGARLALEHLIGLGHRRIAFYTSRMDHASCFDRFFSYKETLTAHGIPYDRDLVVVGQREEAHRELLRLLGSVTAVFATNDVLCMRLITAARDAGLSVPGDFSVVGFDDLALGEHFSPRLTVARAWNADGTPGWFEEDGRRPTLERFFPEECSPCPIRGRCGGIYRRYWEDIEKPTLTPFKIPS